jgi:hypothetical protein
MGAVLVAVGVACMGAFAFGYHLGVVNGPLEAIAKELGFAGNKALSGLVRPALAPGHVFYSMGCHWVIRRSICWSTLLKLFLASG